jgi:hypothetical protein
MLTGAQAEVGQLQLQVVMLQQNCTLLGGNLQGRLGLAQGAVLAELQKELAAKADAVAASEAQLAAFQVLEVAGQRSSPLPKGQ